jgi:hypothetical protein
MDIKFNCSNRACQRRISVDESRAGQSVDCPACGTVLHVPASTNIKFSCSAPDCGQHIVVDVSEAGRFVRCPACGKPAQVPGDPPKPLVPVVAKKPVPAPVEVVPEIVEEEMPSSPPFKRLLFGWGIGAAFVAVVLAGSFFHYRMALPKNLGTMADELFSVGDFRSAPVPNHGQTGLLFPRNVADGGAIYFADLAAHKTSMLSKQAEGASMAFANNHLFAWSPDDRLAAVPQWTNHDDSTHLLVICDPYTGETKQSFDIPAGFREVCWANNNSLVVVGGTYQLYLINQAADASWGQLGKPGVTQLPLSALDEGNEKRHWITRTSDHTVAYIDRGNVWSLDLATGQAVQLTHLAGATLAYLDYDAGGGEFLFDLTDKKHRNALYHLNPNITNGMAAVTTSEGKRTNAPITRILKGQWVLGGQGVAYVKSGLVIKAEGYSTELFADGSLQSYTVAPGGNKIYALASPGNEPLSIWEYDIPSRQLRNAVPATDKPLSASEVIPYQAGHYSGQNGKKSVGYHYLAPAKMDTGKKYPALICVPRGGLWEPDSQLIANSGIFFVSLSKGVGVTNESGLSGKEQEMLTTYYALLGDPNVDPHRIYIMGASHETEWLTKLIKYHPDFWRGAIFVAPVSFPKITNAPSTFPSILISQGDLDLEGRREYVKQFVQKAYQQHVRVRMHYDENGGHILASTDTAKERYEAIIKFILSGY